MSSEIDSDTIILQFFDLFACAFYRFRFPNAVITVYPFYSSPDGPCICQNPNDEPHFCDCYCKPCDKKKEKAYFLRESDYAKCDRACRLTSFF